MLRRRRWAKAGSRGLIRCGTTATTTHTAAGIGTVLCGSGESNQVLTDAHQQVLHMIRVRHV